MRDLQDWGETWYLHDLRENGIPLNADPKHEGPSKHEDANAAHKTLSSTNNNQRIEIYEPKGIVWPCLAENASWEAPPWLESLQIYANIIFSWTAVFCLFCLHSRCACFGSCNSIMRRKRFLTWCWQAIIVDREGLGALLHTGKACLRQGDPGRVVDVQHVLRKRDQVPAGWFGTPPGYYWHLGKSEKIMSKPEINPLDYSNRCIRVYIYIYIFICICICIYIHTYIYIYINIKNICVCVRVCVCVWKTVFSYGFYYNNLTRAECESEVCSRRRRFWFHSGMIPGRWGHVPATLFTDGYFFIEEPGCSPLPDFRDMFCVDVALQKMASG